MDSGVLTSPRLFQIQAMKHLPAFEEHIEARAGIV